MPTTKPDDYARQPCPTTNIDDYRRMRPMNDDGRVPMMDDGSEKDKRAKEMEVEN